MRQCDVIVRPRIGRFACRQRPLQELLRRLVSGLQLAAFQQTVNLRAFGLEASTTPLTFLIQAERGLFARARRAGERLPTTQRGEQRFHDPVPDQSPLPALRAPRSSRAVPSGWAVPAASAVRITRHPETVADTETRSTACIASAQRDRAASCSASLISRSR